MQMLRVEFCITQKFGLTLGKEKCNQPVLYSQQRKKRKHNLFFSPRMGLNHMLICAMIELLEENSRSIKIPVNFVEKGAEVKTLSS